MNKTADPKHRGLGRGLNALFEDEEGAYPQVDRRASDGSNDPTGRSRLTIQIDKLSPGKSQPRHQFDDEAIAQLSDSIKVHGLLQPILVRPDPVIEDAFEIIAGERRWRACQKAQLHEVSVIVVQLDDREALEVALVENLQREDLSAVEEARGYRRLVDEYGHTQEKLAEILGKSRSHVANMMRLLGLPDKVLGYLEAGDLSIGHARALLNTKEPETLAKFVIKEGFTVRQTEDLAMQDQGKSKKKRAPSQKYKDADTIALENDLSSLLGMRVVINGNDKGAGTLSVHYKSLDQLDNLIHRVTQFPKIEKLLHNPSLPVGNENPPPEPKKLMD